MHPIINNMQFKQYIHTCTYIHFSTYADRTGQRTQYKSTWRVFYSVRTALRAVGTLSHNHSLNRRRHEQSLIRQGATKVSGKEMKTQKSSNSARSAIATG